MNRVTSVWLVLACIVTVACLSGSASAIGFTTTPDTGRIEARIGQSGTCTITATAADDPRTQEEKKDQGDPSFEWRDLQANGASPCSIGTVSSGTTSSAILVAGRTTVGVSNVGLTVRVTWPVAQGTGNPIVQEASTQVPVVGADGTVSLKYAGLPAEKTRFLKDEKTPESTNLLFTAEVVEPFPGVTSDYQWTLTVGGNAVSPVGSASARRVQFLVDSSTLGTYALNASCTFKVLGTSKTSTDGRTIAIVAANMKDHGSVEIPFTSNVTKAQLAACLQGTVGKTLHVDGAAITAEIQSQLAPVSLGVPTETLRQKAEELTATAVAKIKADFDSYNATVDAAIDTAATAAKTGLDGLSPKVVISGDYAYQQPNRDPGDPGWTLTAPRVTGLTGISFQGSADLVIRVSFTVEVSFVVGGKITIAFEASAHGRVSLSCEGYAADASGPSPSNRPSGTVSATPGVTIVGSGSAGVGFGITVTVGGSLTDRHDLTRVSGTIVAQQG